jgi:hypothetical protein
MLSGVLRMSRQITPAYKGFGMGYQQEFRVESGVLHAQLSGVFPHDLLREHDNVFQPLADACARGNCSKALIDARKLEAGLNTLDMFRAGVDAALLSHTGVRVAFVAREDMIDLFFAEVARNRGALIGVFTDFEAAGQWLAKQK